jgi:6-pyruvoyltetrahydropterin/6-carboxytetrahydropterin synthase
MAPGGGKHRQEGAAVAVDAPDPSEEAAPAVYELTVAGSFAAAHRLRGYRGDCEKLHGHNWRVEVCLAAGRLDELGMVVDFREVKAVLGEVLDRLDHGYLNEVPPFDERNPTTENLCRHIAEGLAGRLPGHVAVRRVTCWESQGCSASYRPASAGQGGQG